MTASNQLHIIAFDCPYPAHYGGIIDIWYKIKALHQIGIEITLHIFLYRGKQPQDEINKYCKQVFYYNRNIHFTQHLSLLPFIVKSRDSDVLIHNIMESPAPVLMEGIHSTHSLPILQSAKIPCFIRMHNIEQIYYDYLYTIEENIFKKLYFLIEKNKIRSYERIVNHAAGLIFISPHDEKEIYTKTKKTTVFPFHGMDTNTQKAPELKILFHGNFEIQENRIAAHNILSIADNIKLPIIIAGKNADSLPPQNNNTDIQYIANPSDTEMQKLLQTSAIHVLPVAQPTGIKLKLIQSLFTAQYIITSSAMAEDFPWESSVITYDTWSSVPKIIENISKGEITPHINNKLMLMFSDERNAQKLWNFIVENS